jgi:hypothetical protein
VVRGQEAIGQATPGEAFVKSGKHPVCGGQQSRIMLAQHRWRGLWPGAAGGDARPGLLTVSYAET